MSKTPEYRAWSSARHRCTNPKIPKYVHYGGRGIKMCDEWLHSFKAFYEHIGSRPSPLHSLDRIDNDGPYAPGNVRWATRSHQATNKRKGKRRDRIQE